MSAYLEGLSFGQPAVLPVDSIHSMAREYFSSSGSHPMTSKVIIITGSTSGIGKALAVQLYKMGATVIIAAHSSKRCIETAEYLRKQFTDSSGVVHVKSVNMSDLEDVAAFVAWFRSHFNRLDALINNVGINYMSCSSKCTSTEYLRSKQGYDLAFATNYLGPFLLTELLLPVLKRTCKARVVNVSSTSHMLVDGSELSCLSAETASNTGAKSYSPVASNGDINTRHHWMNAYRNSKLAQVMHTKELQRALDADLETDLKVISVSPGLTDTSMVPRHPLARALLGVMLYTPEAACLSPLHALFDPTLCGGEHLSNSWSFWLHTYLGRLFLQLLAFFGLKMWFIKIVVCPFKALFQHINYGIHIEHPKSRCPDAISRELYRWSLEVVDPYWDISYRKRQEFE